MSRSRVSRGQQDTASVQQATASVQQATAAVSSSRFKVWFRLATKQRCWLCCRAHVRKEDVGNAVRRCPCNAIARLREQHPLSGGVFANRAVLPGQEDAPVVPIHHRCVVVRANLWGSFVHRGGDHPIRAAQHFEPAERLLAIWGAVHGPMRGVRPRCWRRRRRWRRRHLTAAFHLICDAARSDVPVFPPAPRLRRAYKAGVARFVPIVPRPLVTAGCVAAFVFAPLFCINVEIGSCGDCIPMWHNGVDLSTR